MKPEVRNQTMIILKLLHVQGMEKIGNFLFLINASSTNSKICQSFARVETNYSFIYFRPLFSRNLAVAIS